MKTQLLNYETAKTILAGFRFVGCRFTPNFFNKSGMMVFNPKERHTVTIDITDAEKGFISFIKVSYRVYLRLFPQC